MPMNPSLLFADVIAVMSNCPSASAERVPSPYFHDSPSLRDFTSFCLEPFASGSKALSAGPPGPAEILPGTAIHIALRIQGLRTRVFRGIELKDHPLRIRNARIRRRVEKPDFFVREPKVYGTDVIFQLLSLPGSDDHAANGRPAQHPRQRRTGRACVMPTSHLLKRFHDAVAHLLVEGHERTCLRESCAGRSRVGAAVLAREEAAGKRAPNQNTDVVVLGERLELVFETSADEAVVHLRRHVFFQPEALLQHNRGGRLP